MESAILVRGLIIGVSIAAPVGPIGLLCIQRTLNEGRKVGVATGLGAATADATYGLVAALGLTAISAFLIDQKIALALIGGAMLIFLGVRTFLAKPATAAAQVEGYRYGNLWSAFGSTLLLTLTNPMTVLMFVAIFAGAGVAQTSGDWLGAFLMVLGVFLGSAAWWLLLTSLVTLIGKRITPNVMAWINRGAGVLLMIFGVVALVYAAA